MEATEKKAGAEAGAVEVPASELKAIREEFDRRWWRQLGISGLTAGAVVPLVLVSESAGPAGPPLWMVGLGMVGALVAVAGSLWNWRCPSCNSYFGKRFLFMKFCGSCGVPLVES